ncbi:DUF3892 domain-containing protein [Corallococcus sp. H22C18031201]|nr:DUF3892 domain-containing protein [Corallococcus sp. H22C18031201]
MPNVPELQVTCITLSSPGSGHEAITHIGANNQKWAVANVIAAIQTKTSIFYTFVNGSRADVGVVNGQSGPYLRTYADGKWTDNLLALRRCP